MSKTALSQPSSRDTICLSDSDYTKIVNGLIRLQELDTLYKLCQLKVANADSQIANYEQIVVTSDSIISRYKGLTDSLRVNLHLANRDIHRQRRFALGATGVAIVGWLVAILRRP